MAEFQIELLIDGECPICRREGRVLQWLDRGRGRVRLTDIAAPDFEAARYGLTRDQAMASMHGALPDGRVITGMEVFRRAYAAVGLGWLLAPTAWPGFRPLFDALYRTYARNRLRLTGRACITGRCVEKPRP